MKHLIIAALAVVLAMPALAKGGRAGSVHSGASRSSSHVSKAATGTGAKLQHEHVSSYTKSNGAHVTDHERSTKDNTKTNNWSTKGNANPMTGKKGSK